MFGPMAILFLCNGKLFHVSLISNSPRDRAGIARSQPDRSKSDSERVTAISTRNAPSVSTDRPGTGSDRIWVRSFANTGKEHKTIAQDPGIKNHGSHVQKSEHALKGLPKTGPRIVKLRTQYNRSLSDPMSIGSKLGKTK